jgi:hypothetical protein
LLLYDNHYNSQTALFLPLGIQRIPLELILSCLYCLRIQLKLGGINDPFLCQGDKFLALDDLLTHVLERRIENHSFTEVLTLHARDGGGKSAKALAYDFAALLL